MPRIRKFAPDYIHLHDPELLLISPVFRLFGFKLIYDMHENFYRELDDKPISGFSRSLQKLAWLIIEALILNKIPIVFAEKSYKKYFSTDDEVMVVQNFPREKSVSEKYQRAGVCHHTPKFVYLGTISFDRGAIKMVHSLDSSFGPGNYELNYIGDITDPTLEAELNKILSSNTNIIYHGYQAMPDAWEICIKCDVGLAILDAKHNYIQSYPTKLFEYLICGLPIITSNFNLYRGLVERHNIGFCIDPSDSDDITRALKAIVVDVKYSELSRSVSRFSFHDFTWEFEFAKFTDYLKKS
jgi:glycosyltransferase involved in cell wall biosynthesis